MKVSRISDYHKRYGSLQMFESQSHVSSSTGPPPPQVISNTSKRSNSNKATFVHKRKSEITKGYKIIENLDEEETNN